MLLCSFGHPHLANNASDECRIRKLNSRPATILFSGRTWLAPEAYFDLLRSGQCPQRILGFDVEPHRVSRTEYEKIFGNH